MVKSLKLTYQRLLNNVSDKHYRFLFDQFNLDDRLTGLVGPRGVGKTTLLLQYIRMHLADKKNVFYFSADHIYFGQTTLYEFIEDMVLSEGIEIFFMDEIHKYKNWNQELKNIYDNFPTIKLVFSGSSSLELVKGSYDLSRRAKLFYLPGMSFREYLNITINTMYKPISFSDLMRNYQGFDEFLADVPKIKGHFKNYLRNGFYPFYLENPKSYHEKILEVINKTVHEDVASFYNLKTANLHQLKKILSFIATMQPGTLSVHNIGKNLSIDDKTVMNYLIYLTETGLTNLVYAVDGGHIGLRRPEKVFLNNTNLQYAIEGELGSDISIGAVRELFFIQSVAGLNETIFYSKQGDYCIQDYLFEIGGKNKKNKQIQGADNAFLIKDDILVSTKREIPLILFGFLY